MKDVFSTKNVPPPAALLYPPAFDAISSARISPSLAENQFRPDLIVENKIKKKIARNLLSASRFEDSVNQRKLSVWLS